MSLKVPERDGRPWKKGERRRSDSLQLHAVIRSAANLTFPNLSLSITDASLAVKTDRKAKECRRDSIFIH